MKQEQANRVFDKIFRAKALYKEVASPWTGISLVPSLLISKPGSNRSSDIDIQKIPLVFKSPETLFPKHASYRVRE